MLAARKFGWPKPARKRNHGVGFAFGKYKNLMAYVAMAIEVSVVPETGQVVLERAEVAVDSGQIVNPDKMGIEFRRAELGERFSELAID